MNRLSNIPLLFSFLILSLTISCSGGNSGKKVRDNATAAEPAPDPVINEDTRLLIKDLDENGDYVNSRNFPSLIKASSVYDASGTDIHIIDIRGTSDFNMGHLQDAVNISFDALPEYLMTGIKPFEFEKIIIVSADGQLASYTTSLLRLMGYGNVYALRWGMSGWNTLFADSGWLKGCSSDNQSNLETTVNSKSAAKGMPVLNTGLLTGEEIANHRFDLMFKAGLDEVMIDASTVFAYPADYYIINYDRRDKYESGHIPGAVRYKPGATLSIVNEMSTIPVDKTIVVYCGTGHNSGFVTAYLRLFGYDARTLRYGNNGFMYEKMMADRATLSWLPFTSVDISDYDFIK
jgi:rhodanese-related sulfurtransferase